MPRKVPSIANVIADRYTEHNVKLLRFEAGERARVRNMLQRLSADLSARLDDGSDNLTDFSRRRLQSVMRAADRTIQQSYAKIARQQTGSLVQLGEIESEGVLDVINGAIGVPLLNSGLSSQQLKALVDDDIVKGRPAAEWWDRQAKNLQARFREQIRQGVFAGETLGELKRRIRGTRERQFRDGIMDVTSRDADALIRTSVQSVANAARHETYQENADVVEGQQWLSTLDNRTTEQCMALSGQSWDLDGNPINDSVLDFPGPPPIHWNCRSTLIPCVKSWGDLIREANGNESLARRLDRVESKIDAGTQASMDGQVAADLNYEDWLRMKDEENPEFAQEVLGPAKYELWKAGELSFTDLIDQSHRPLTVEELRNL